MNIFYYSKASPWMLLRGRPLKNIFYTNLLGLLLTLTCFVASASSGAQNEIYIKSTNERFDLHLSTKQQELVQNGRVVDQGGLPVAGATIQELGTSNQTQSDVDGYFMLSVKNETSKLRISMIGSKAVEINYSSESQTVILNRDPSDMEEVVVVGFGQQKKESVVGAISTISSKDLRVPTSTLSNAFAGRIAGVVAVQRGGEPGADGSNFWIRGISTFTGNTSPLIFIDGVESSIGDMNNLAPEVIDNFSVLKDASATALYGARGANGVLLITTRRGGDMERARISFRMDNTLSAPTQTFKMANAVDYMELYNYAITNRNPNATPRFSQEKIDGTRDGLDPIAFPNVDWQDYLFKDYALNQYANLNVTGGGKRADYFISATFNNDNGMLKSDPLNTFNNNVKQKEYNLIANVGVNLTKNTNAVVRINTQLLNYGGSAESTGTIYSRIFESPVSLFLPVFPSDPSIDHIRFGNALGGPKSVAGSGIYENPYATMVSGTTDRFATTNTASFELNQLLDIITPGLKAKALLSFKNYSQTSVTRSFEPFYYESTSLFDNETNTYNHTYTSLTRGNKTLSTSAGSSGDRLMNINLVIDWLRSFGQHDISGMVAYLQRDYNVNNPASGLTSNLYWNTLAYRNQGIAGRLTYGYASKYFFEGNFGYNGSENFAEGNRFGFFPSLAAGYMISNEKFWTPIQGTINSLKFRASWGKVGNDQIVGSRFPYLDKIDPNLLGYVFGNEWQTSGSGAQISTLGAPGAKWEVGTKYNLGIDLGLKNVLSLTADYFTETRNDIFMQRRIIAAETGIVGSNPFANIGKVRSSGFDASLSADKQIGDDFFVNLRGTFTYAKNILLDRDEPILEYEYLSEIGRPLNRFFGYLSDGLYQDLDDIANSPTSEIGQNLLPGDIKYRDLNGDGVINADDRTQFGNPQIPQIVYGFGASSKYKNFDFSLFFQGTAKTSLLMSNIHPYTGNATNLLQFIADDHWTEENRNAQYPRLVHGVSDHNNFYTSDFWMREGSFIRLKNVELGYTYKFARVYFAGQNLLTFSKFKYWDPELGSGNGLSYPNLRIGSIGFQLQF